MRKTQIVATLGPKSWDKHIIRDMILAGVDVFRFNLSHVRSSSDYSFLAGVVKITRKIAKEIGREVQIMVDTPGHKFRLGQFVDRMLHLGDSVELTRETKPQNGEIPFPHPQHLALMKVGQEIVIADGIPRFKVVRTASSTVLCEVVLPGILEPFKGLTVRGLKIANLSLPPFTQADKQGLEFAVEVAADQVVMSYGTSADQLRSFKKEYRDLGGIGQVIFKYELGEAGEDLPAIIEESDFGFVGQGDLGLSISSRHVPAEGALVIKKYREKGKPCIVGTQLLTSMKTHPSPTHGERNGIYYLIGVGATGLMVSDETAMGEYPVEVVVELNKLIMAAEAPVERT